MANSYDLYPTVDGATSIFNVTFGYINRSHVKAFVDNVEVTFTWLTGSSVQLDATPSAGATVKLQRITPRDARLVDFEDGSTLSGQDLDTNSLQSFYIAQEVLDENDENLAKNNAGAFDAGGAKVAGLAAPTDAQDATTKAYVDAAVAGVPAAQAAAEAARDAAQASQTAAAGSASAASAAQGAAETARDQAVAAAASLDLSPYATIAYTDGAINSFAAQLPGGLADRLRWLEVNLALNTVRDVIDAGWTTMELVDGFADEFNDEGGVDLATSAGEAYDAAGDFYTNAFLETLIPRTDGTAIGTMTGDGGVAAAFDGVTSQASGSCAGSGAGGGNVGKDWGAGVTKTVTGFRFYGPSDVGIEAVNPGLSLTVTLAGSADGSSWTTLWSGPITNTAAGGQVFSVTSGIDISAAYRYHRVNVATGNSFAARCAELEFFEPPSEQAMVLVSSAFTASTTPVAARAVLLVDPQEAITLNTDLIAEISRDDGTTWTAGTLTYEADYDPNVQIMATDEIDLTGQPSGTQVRIRVRTPTSKSVQVHAWTTQWR